MSERQLQDWQAYYAADPWDEDRADLRTGILASLIANQWRAKGSKRAKPQDFMLYPMPKEVDPERELAAALRSAKAFAAMTRAKFQKR